MPSESAPYDRDVAYVHSSGYSDIMLPAAREVIQQLRQRNLHEGTIIDLGCGGGQAAAAYAAAQYDVIGVDLSPAMIDLARQAVNEARFEVGSWNDWPLPSCVAITALGEIFCYLSPGVEPRVSLPSFFASAHAALLPGGLLAFDVGEIGMGRGAVRNWTSGDDWYCLVDYAYDEGNDQLARHITTFRQEGELYRRRHETHRQQLFAAVEIQNWLEQVGFQVAMAQRLDEFVPLPNRALFFATKV
ncbi:MAG: class I SAM-dependent methyltransferase [Blastopirellula sp. JB062]